MVLIVEVYYLGEEVVVLVGLPNTLRRSIFIIKEESNCAFLYFVSFRYLQAISVDSLLMMVTSFPANTVTSSTTLSHVSLNSSTEAKTEITVTMASDK